MHVLLTSLYLAYFAFELSRFGLYADGLIRPGEGFRLYLDTRWDFTAVSSFADHSLVVKN